MTAENRLLKSLHKRQDSALSKYESSSAELPQLLHSHAEEVRVWQTRSRNLQRQNKELQSKIKQKDIIILTVTDQNKHLLQLNKDKNLEEREKLADRVRDLEQRLFDKDNDMKLLARRLQLETKAFKTNLYMEQQKYRDLVSKIELSEYMLQRTDINDKKLPKPLRQQVQRGKSPTRVSKSTTSIANDTRNDGIISYDKEQTPLVLPPCEGPEKEKKKPEESMKANTPRSSVNTNVKLATVIDKDEATPKIMPKNRSDRNEALFKNGHSSHDGEDEIVVSVRNGMTRARLPQKSNKNSAKLTPLHPKQDSKPSSDDSEFSDSDIQLFSEHNGTKMVTMSPVVVRESKNVLGVYLGPFSWKFA